MKEEKFNYLYSLKERIFDFINGQEPTTFSDLENHFGNEFSGVETAIPSHLL